MALDNFDDVLGQLQAFGLDVVAGDVEIGTRKRCRHTDGGREKRGWFQLYELPKQDGSGSLIVGSFGAFWGAENVVQKVELPKADRQQMTPDQLAALKARIAEDKKRAAAEQQARNDKAARIAEQDWRACLPVGESEYLKRKGVEGFGIRYSPSGHAVIPMMDAERRIYGLQIIYAAKKHGRDKDFYPAGLAKKGHFFLIGNVDRICLVAEGYATGASLHMATGLPVAVAFDAGNLLPVAQALHAKYKRANLLICADDDYLTEGNPGVAHAKNAALAVNGSVIVPVFSVERPADSKGATDFNDLHLTEGMHVVTKQVENHLTGIDWAESNAPKRADSAQKGGGETTGRRHAVAVLELDSIVERFVPLDDGTGDYVFDKWTNKVAKKSQMISLLPAGVRGDDIKRHPYWIERGAYYLDQVGFDPSGKDRNVALNTWQGWPMKPKAGKCTIMLELIENLCSKETNGVEVFDWLINWMAYPLQNPGAKMASAVVMHGPQGTGKTTVFKAICQIYGQYGLVVDQDAIEDKFNSDWGENRLFILAEEIVSRMEMWHVKNKLKNLVTGDTIRINPKGMIAYSQKNHLNIVYLSNENQPLPLENDDRRHLVVYTPPALSEMFFDELYEEIENGGVEAFYHYLMARDLSGFHPKKRPPMTQAKKNLIGLSAASELRFCQEWILGDTEWPVVPCLATDFYAAYLKWCRTNGESRPRPSNQFFGAIAHQQGWEKKKVRIYPQETSMTTEPKPMVIPPQAALDAAETTMPDGSNHARWLGECARRFGDAMRGDSERWAA